MISDKNLASLTVETHVILTMVVCRLSIFGRLTIILGEHSTEGAVDRQTLIRHSSNTGCIRTSRKLGLLCLDTSRTDFKYSSLSLELRNTKRMLVYIIQVFITRMTQPLVPQHLFSMSTNGDINWTTYSRSSIRNCNIYAIQILNSFIHFKCNISMQQICTFIGLYNPNHNVTSSMRKLEEAMFITKTETATMNEIIHTPMPYFLDIIKGTPCILVSAQDFDKKLEQETD